MGFLAPLDRTCVIPFNVSFSVVASYRTLNSFFSFSFLGETYVRSGRVDLGVECGCFGQLCIFGNREAKHAFCRYLVEPMHYTIIPWLEELSESGLEVEGDYEHTAFVRPIFRMY